MKANRTWASFLRVRHVGYRTQLSADGHCVLHPAPMLEMDVRCVSVKRVFKTSLASERTVESTTVLVRVVQVSKTQSLRCEILLMDPSVLGRELRERVTGFSAPRTSRTLDVCSTSSCLR